jgi:hypothetical protein
VTILGLVVVVLLALFVVSAAHKPGDGGPGSGCSPVKRDTWRARLLPPTPVTRGQLSGCTTTLGAFTIAEQCTLEIAAADARSRQLVVKAIDPLKLTIITNADGRTITMQPKLERDQKAQIFVGKDRKKIVFHCLNGTSCGAHLE